VQALSCDNKNEWEEKMTFHLISTITMLAINCATLTMMIVLYNRQQDRLKKYEDLIASLRRLL
jgi:preprotein translocase subunit YajC